MQSLLVQLTDAHIREPGRLAYGRLNTAPYLQTAVQAVLALRQQPDAVVITGDLTDFGRDAEYQHLRSLLAPLAHLPLYLMPGNHDDRAAMRANFPEHTYLGTQGPIHYSVAVGGMQLIALDSSVPEQPHGHLDAGQLAWLRQTLEANRHRPVVVALHHPPFDTLIGHMDKIGVREGKAELLAILADFPNVQRVISGHIHRSIQRRFAHAIACTAPSVAHQVCLDLAPDAASAWTLEPPGFMLHALADDGEIVSHTASTAASEGPFPFHDNGVLID